MSFKIWLEHNDGKYHFVTNCVSSNGEDISAMLDHPKQKDITRETFLKYVDRNEMKEIEKDLGYGPWLSMSKDWHVGYSKSVFKGVPCVYFTWSAIEYIFTLNGDT